MSSIFIKIFGKLLFLYNKRFNIYILKRNRTDFGTFDINGRIYVRNNGLLRIGNNFSANSGLNKNPIGGDTTLRLITQFPESILILGNNIGISNSTIYCWQKIVIGNNVIIGGSVKIWDTNFHSTDPVIRTSNHDTDIRSAPIHIADNVFIGAGSIILKGVSIGENSVIAAGSVVVKSIPADVIAGGNPCKVIRSLKKTE